MGFWDIAKRAGLAVGTGGLSEAGGARTLYDAGKYVGGKVMDWGQAQAEEDARRAGLLEGEAGAASRFADTGQQGYRRTGREMGDLADAFRRQASGQDSFSAEQLRQSLGQQQAAQLSMAASARPGNQAMAARQAMLGMGRAGSAAAGNQALAGIQERQAANQALGQLLATQRGQDLQAAIGSRGQAITGYGGLADDPTLQDRLWGLAGGALAAGGQVGGAALGSDKRLKKDIKDGDDDADAFIAGLKSYSYKYRDRKWGEGKQLGVMAQDVERTPFGKQIVRDTPAGKVLDSAKLSGANTAAIARLGERLSKLERKGR